MEHVGPWHSHCLPAKILEAGPEHAVRGQTQHSFPLLGPQPAQKSIQYLFCYYFHQEVEVGPEARLCGPVIADSAYGCLAMPHSLHLAYTLLKLGQVGKYISSRPLRFAAAKLCCTTTRIELLNTGSLLSI